MLTVQSAYWLTRMTITIILNGAKITPRPVLQDYGTRKKHIYSIRILQNVNSKTFELILNVWLYKMQTKKA